MVVKTSAEKYVSLENSLCFEFLSETGPYSTRFLQTFASRVFLTKLFSAAPASVKNKTSRYLFLFHGIESRQFCDFEDISLVIRIIPKFSEHLLV